MRGALKVGDEPSGSGVRRARRRIHPRHVKRPHFPLNLAAELSGPIWLADITYISTARNFICPLAAVHWFSRYVPGMDADFCVDALKITQKKARPAILGTDQGRKFTSERPVDTLLTVAERIGMVGSSRALDNVCFVRLRHSLRYENIHLRGYADT